jgi:hypothetical protein
LLEFVTVAMEVSKGVDPKEVSLSFVADLQGRSLRSCVSNQSYSFAT